MTTSQPWLRSAEFDLPFILCPPLISVLFVLAYMSTVTEVTPIPLWGWVVVVLCVDVAHVYSTLFRTYFHSDEVRANRSMLVVIPVVCWLIGVFLYSFGAEIFWRFLAYTAVFHFMRQQYGFMRLYSRKDVASVVNQKLSTSVIYLATLYPILYWHTHQPRRFHWFVQGDFITGIPEIVSTICGAVYLVVASAYFASEVVDARKQGFFNIPKNALIVGTMMSWYVGIVLFDGDLAFGVTNVVAHGIPYMALVWLYGRRQSEQSVSPRIFGRVPYSAFFSTLAVPLFIGLLILFAYVEEGLWAGLVWRDHLEFFFPFADLSAIEANDTLTWLVPLLTLPQATHYVLDGFIWRIRETGANWQVLLFGNGSKLETTKSTQS